MKLQNSKIDKDFIFYRVESYCVEYSFKKIKEYNPENIQHILFNTLSKCLEFIANHKEKDDMKYIAIYTQYKLEKQEIDGVNIVGFETVLFFKYDEEKNVIVNNGLKHLIPKIK